MEKGDGDDSVSQENTLTCQETMLGDLGIRCAGRAHQMVVRFEAAKRLVRIDNTAREEFEPKVVLSIEGYETDSGTREARLMRNEEAVNLNRLMLGQLRVLAAKPQSRRRVSSSTAVLPQ